MADELKILQKIFDMMEYGYLALQQYPKSEKFALVTDIKRSMNVLLKKCIEAQKKYYKSRRIYERTKRNGVMIYASHSKKLTPYNFTAMSNKQNLYIVIHYVSGVSTAKNNVDYYAREKLSASATYFVDETSIWQCVEDYNRAWHCGGGLQGSGGHAFYQKCTNSNSIGIEMCCKKTSSGTWYFEYETVKNTVDLTKYLMKKYSIPIDRVIRHYDVTGKICPEPYVRDETAWNNFKNMLINEEEKEMTAQEKANFEALQKEVETLKNTVHDLANPMIYAWVDDNMPEWARDTVTKLMQKGYLKGDDEGKLNLTYDMLRIMVMLDRAGAFDK